MIKLNELHQKIKENKWLIAAILFFIVWKFFLIHTLWQDRSIPPEPDDSYNYLTQIVSIAGCNTEGCPTTISMRDGSGYVYLSYRLFLGLLTKITGFSPQTTYYISFYLGTLFLAILLVPLIKTLSSNKNLIAWTIFFLSFYHGLGETHGFFWVVPSFFLLLLFFLLFIFSFQEERKFNPWFVGALSIIYTFSHPMSVFLIFIFPLYLSLITFFTRHTSWNTWKRVLFIIFIILLSSYASQHPLLNKLPEENSYNLQKIISQTQLNTKLLSKSDDLPKTQELIAEDRFFPATFFSPYQTLLSERVKLLSQTYFRWLLPSWIFVIPFLLSFFILLYKRELEIISLYLVSFLFFIATTVLDPLGYRTAILLWPITFIFFAFSSWYGLEILQEKTKGWVQYLLVSLSILLLSLFFLLNVTFAFFFNENINVRNDYPIELELVQYLEALPTQATVTFSREFVIAEMWNMPTIRARSVHLTTQPNYIITTNFSEVKEKTHSPFSQSLKRWATKFSLPQSSSSPRSSSPLLPNYVLEKKFGTFDLYKRLP